MKIKRSIFIKRFNHIIGEHTTEDIKEEIEKPNNWKKITEVTKIKKLYKYKETKIRRHKNG